MLLIPSMMQLQLRSKQFIHRRKAPFCFAVATGEGAVPFLLLMQLQGKKFIPQQEVPFVPELQLLKEQCKAPFLAADATAG